MKLISARLQNFRSHRDTRVCLGSGVLAITGENGAGKSSIFEGVMWALFGACRTRTQEELVRTGAHEAAVHVVFQVGEIAYEVYRAYRTQGKSGTTHLTFAVATHEHRDLTQPTVAETERAIVAIVGPYHVLAATAYVGQGDGDRFLRARPAERRDIFGASLAVDPRWGQWQATATVKGKEIATAISQADAQRTVAEAQAATLLDLMGQQVAGEKDTARWQSAVQQAEAVYDGLNTRALKAAAVRQQNATLQDRLNELRWQLGKIQPKVRQLRVQIEADEALIAQAAAIRQEATRVTTLAANYKQAIVDHDDAMRQYARVQAEWERGRRMRVEGIEVTKKNVALRADMEAQCALAERSLAEARAQPADRCVTCKQPLMTGEAAQHVADHRRYLDGRLAEFKAKLALLPETPAEIVPALGDELAAFDLQRPQMPVRPADPSMSEYTAALSRLTTLEATEARIDNECREVEELEAQAVELPTRIATVEAQIQPELSVRAVDVEEARKRLLAARSSLESHVRSQAALAQRVESAQAARAKAEALAGELADLRRQQEVYNLIAEACGPRGVRQLVADQALEAVQDEANRRLAVLQPGHSVYFSTLSEGGKETLDVGIATPEGLRSFESLSGGEGTRVAVAVRIAMSTVAANMHGLAALPAFWLDEAFGSQDAAGRDAFVECIADLAQTVGQVVVVSHDRDFQDRFDNKIVIQKTDGESRVIA